MTGRYGPARSRASGEVALSKNMASRTPIDQNLLADLVERRIEAPDVEYKNFMPLVENVERANIARHLSALANFGGGWLVFGFGVQANELLADSYPISRPGTGRLRPENQLYQRRLNESRCFAI